MRTTPETMAFLRGQAQSDSHAWGGLCLKLQRTARGIDAMFPTAISAQHGTPSANRFKLSEAKRGMVGYFVGQNPAGHITAVAGRDKNTGELLHWTNDAPSLGQVSMVRHSFFKQFWGDEFQFAADWLNGQVLDLPGEPKPPLAGGGPSIVAAIQRLRVAVVHHRKKGHTALVKALERDIAHLENILQKFGGKQ